MEPSKVDKKQWQSCCGASSFIFNVSTPIKRSHLHFFIDEGYTAPKNFSEAGIFYITNGSITATSSFGSTKINVRCNGEECQDLVNKFEQILIMINK